MFPPADFIYQHQYITHKIKKKYIFFKAICLSARKRHLPDDLCSKTNDCHLFLNKTECV